MAPKPTSKELLTEWSIWMLGQNRNTNDTSGDTTGGTIIQAENKNGTHKYSDTVWFIPGTWGQTVIPDRDRITVPEGKGLFVIVASNHVTKPELKATEPDMKKHLGKIKDLWFTGPALLVGRSMDQKEPVESLEFVETDMFNVDINPNSQYAVLTRGPHGEPGVSGNQDMIVSAWVHSFTPQLGETYMTIGGQSQKAPNLGYRGEKEYNIQVNYKVTVTPQQP